MKQEEFHIELIKLWKTRSESMCEGPLHMPETKAFLKRKRKALRKTLVHLQRHFWDEWGHDKEWVKELVNTQWEI